MWYHSGTVGKPQHAFQPRTLQKGCCAHSHSSTTKCFACTSQQIADSHWESEQPPKNLLYILVRDRNTAEFGFKINPLEAIHSFSFSSTKLKYFSEQRDKHTQPYSCCQNKVPCGSTGIYSLAILNESSSVYTKILLSFISVWFVSSENRLFWLLRNEFQLEHK